MSTEPSNDYDRNERERPRTLGRVARSIAAIAVLMLLGTGLGAQPPAHAHHAVGTAWPAWVRCYNYFGTGSDGALIWTHWHARAAPGWDRQYVAYQYFVSTYDPTTKRWSGWRAEGPPRTTIATSQNNFALSVFGPLINTTTPGYHYVMTRYWWYDGSSWSQPRDYVTTEYTIATPTLAGELHRRSNVCETSRDRFRVSMGPTVSTTFP